MRPMQESGSLYALPAIVFGLFAAAWWGALQLPKETPAEIPAASPVALPTLTGLEACVPLREPAARYSCFRATLEPHLQERAPRDILSDLDRLQEEQLAFRSHCHEMAHVLGRLWIARGSPLADGFVAGSSVCHSGFFHGMVERVFIGESAAALEPTHLSVQELLERAPVVCTTSALGTAKWSLRYQCLHGLGHAAAFSLAYDLPQALRVCDALPEKWDRHSCAGGAFMENITGSDRERRMLRSDDPHYPCRSVDEKYRNDCYIMQTSWLVEQSIPWEKIVALCQEAGPHRLACFQSLGRDLSPLARTDNPAVPTAICEKLPADERSSCIQGTVYALADHSWDGRFAYPFCTAFSEMARETECFREAHGHLINLLDQSRETAETGCRRLESPHTEQCLSVLPDLE